MRFRNKFSSLEERHWIKFFFYLPWGLSIVQASAKRPVKKKAYAVQNSEGTLQWWKETKKPSKDVEALSTMQLVFLKAKWFTSCFFINYNYSPYKAPWAFNYQEEHWQSVKQRLYMQAARTEMETNQVNSKLSGRRNFASLFVRRNTRR